MRKKTFFWMLATLVLLVAVIGGGLFLLVSFEPDFYARCRIEPGQNRKDQSTRFLSHCLNLVNAMVDGGRDEWTFTFTQEQLNSYFEEDFVRLGDAELLKKQGVTEPRISIGSDRIRLGFRYGNDTWSTVFSVDFRIWLAPKDLNVVALEILGRRFGALPVPAQSLCEQLSELARQKNIEVSWYRYNQNPVALLRFHGERSRPSAQLSRLELTDGSITVSGQSFEPGVPVSPP